MSSGVGKLLDHVAGSVFDMLVTGKVNLVVVPSTHSWYEGTKRFFPASVWFVSDPSQWVDLYSSQYHCHFSLVSLDKLKTGLQAVFPLGMLFTNSQPQG